VNGPIWPAGVSLLEFERLQREAARCIRCSHCGEPLHPIYQHDECAAHRAARLAAPEAAHDCTTCGRAFFGVSRSGKCPDCIARLAPSLFDLPQGELFGGGAS
jgi:ribosomal protein L34E